jgi:hypothetical protein
MVLVASFPLVVFTINYSLSKVFLWARNVSHPKQEVLGRTNSPTFSTYVIYLKYLNLISCNLI